MRCCMRRRRCAAHSGRPSAATVSPAGAGAESALVVSISCDEPPALVDLRADKPVCIGAPSAVAPDGNHAAGRSLSGAVHGGVPEADGFMFASRFTGDSCVAIFERAYGRLWASGIAELVRHVEFPEALDDYDQRSTISHRSNSSFK